MKTEYRSIDVRKCIEIAKAINEEYENTPIVDIHHSCEGAEIHIAERGMSEVAPLETWALNMPRRSEEVPYHHQIIIDGITFYAISKEPIALPAAEVIE
jgi:hypothetical protein